MSADNLESAFWLRPDWSGGDNLRDPGTTPFWCRPPLPRAPAAIVASRGIGQPPRALASLSHAELVELARAHGVDITTRTRMIGEIMALTRPRR